MALSFFIFLKGINTMTKERMLELLDIERQCIIRNDKDICDRKCENCDLVQDTKELLVMYDMVYSLLKTHKEHTF